MDVWVAKAIQQMERQTRTNDHYRQQKYNLLQEESEGYSKLIDTLHSYFASPSHITSSPTVTAAIAGRVTALIGYFDLDPNRVLDVLLTVYVAVCGAGGDGSGGGGAVDGLAGLLQLLQLFGTSHLTQLVGFQLQRQLAGGAVQTGLLIVVGLLVREGRLAVEDVWSHLGGAGGDDEMAKLREEWEAEERKAASRIGLANLSSTADSKPTSDEEKKQPTTATSTSTASTATAAKQPQASHRDDAPIVMSEPISTTSPSLVLEQPLTLSSPSYSPAHNAKFGLLAALITAGAWSDVERVVVYMAALDPVSHPVVSSALGGCVARLIAPLYAKVKGAYGVLSGEAEVAMVDEAAVSDDACAALPAALSTPLTRLGPYLYTDPLLWTQLCRVLSYVVAVLKKRHTGDAARFTLPAALQSIVTTALLPAYVLLPSSIARASLLWSILSLLPYTARYSLYGYWHISLPQAHPLLALHHTSLTSKTRYFRKRISTAKVKECSRLLLKFALPSPTSVFALILQQVQQFDNMIGVVVEMLRYMPVLVLDTVAWVLLWQMSERTDKLKEDGMNESDWYQSLCRFAGAMWRRWPDVECESLLQYVMNQLKMNQPLDLLLLKELVAGVSGVEVYEEMSELVMEGRGGSRLLQAETMTQRNVTKNKRRATGLLVDTLTRAQLLVPFYVLLCSEKDGIVYESEYEHVRLIAELHDKCADAQLQYADMLDQHLTDAEWQRAWPSLHQLCHTYGLAVADAMHVLRRVIHLPRVQGNGEWRRLEEQRKKEEADSQAAMSDDSKPTPTKQPTHAYAALHHTFTLLLPPTTLSAIPVAFYSLFWRLSMYHLHVPKQAYESAAKKLRSQIAQVEKGEGEWAGSTEDKKGREKERINRLVARLKEDETRHTQDNQMTLNQMRRDKDGWLATITRDFFAPFVHSCILPRVFLSPIDALYTARFLSTLVRLQTPRFCVILVLDNLIREMLAGLLSSATAQEASRFGRFLCECLAELHRCVFDKPLYEREYARNPVFACSVNEPNGRKFAHFQVVMICERFHKNIHTALSERLASTDKHEQGNALLLLVKIGSEWPKFVQQGTDMEKKLETLIAAEGKEGSSLKVLATRAHALLTAQKKNWKREDSVSSKPPEAPSQQQAGRAPPAAGPTVAAQKPQPQQPVRTAPSSAPFSVSPPSSAASSVAANRAAASAGRPMMVDGRGTIKREERDGRSERNERSDASRAAPTPAPSASSIRAPSPPPLMDRSTSADGRSGRKPPRPPSPETPSRSLNPNAPAFTPDSERGRTTEADKRLTSGRDSKERDREREAERDRGGRQTGDRGERSDGRVRSGGDRDSKGSRERERDVPAASSKERPPGARAEEEAKTQPPVTDRGRDSTDQRPPRPTDERKDRDSTREAGRGGLPPTVAAATGSTPQRGSAGPPAVQQSGPLPPAARDSTQTPSLPAKRRREDSGDSTAGPPTPAPPGGPQPPPPPAAIRSDSRGSADGRDNQNKRQRGNEPVMPQSTGRGTHSEVIHIAPPNMQTQQQQQAGRRGGAGDGRSGGAPQQQQQPPLQSRPLITMQPQQPFQPPQQQQPPPVQQLQFGGGAGAGGGGSGGHRRHGRGGRH